VQLQWKRPAKGAKEGSMSREQVRWSVGYLAALAVSISALLLLAGCSINVRDKKDGKEEKVEIETPVGSLRVRTEAEPTEVGLAVYPGARRVKDGDHDNGSAHVNIQSSMFGVKVVAIRYESDDPPDKVLSFYRKELGRYGKVIECPNGIDMDIEDKREMAQEVRCESSPKHDRKKGEVDLAVGSSERHRIINVEPQGKGSKFAMVYIQTRGERGTL
jgi:hypothetical protein